MNKADRDAGRAAVMAAYQSRIASGEYNLSAGFIAWTLFPVLHATCLFVLAFVPLGLLRLAESYFGPQAALDLTVFILVFGGVLFYLARVLIPMASDVVWRMDIFSNKMGYVRPNDVYQLFSLWFWMNRKASGVPERLPNDA